MKQNKLFKNIKLILRGINFVFGFRKVFMPIMLFNALTTALFPFVSIYMSAQIVDALILGKKRGQLISLIFITIAASLIVFLLQKASCHLKVYYQEIINYDVKKYIDYKTLTMDYKHVESPDVMLLRKKIFEGSAGPNAYNALIKNIDDILKSFFSIGIAIFIVFETFYSYSGRLEISSLFLIAVVIICILVAMQSKTLLAKKHFVLVSKFAPINRFLGYYLTLSNDDYSAGKAIRLYKESALIKAETDNYIQESMRVINKIGRTNGFYNAINMSLSSLAGGIVFVYICLSALDGAVSIGGIVKFTTSINQFITGFTTIMTSFTQLIMNNLYLSQLFEYIDIKNDTLEECKMLHTEPEYELRLEDVSFKYPGTENNVLENISLTIKFGERLVLVGLNGSGKTTLIKLLCRLYKPSRGRILLNGTDINEYKREDYNNLISAVFQDFKLFSFSIGQNISSNKEYDREKAESYLNKIGCLDRIKAMPNGLETSIYKDFEEDAIEISGGEAQKISIARALYKNTPFIFLDEPTAALDPIAEYEIYSKINEIVGDKTVIYISHRLSSCRFCERIIVLHKGAIVEEGSHESLMAKSNGMYKEMWIAQAQHYI